jgi:hypothetical protein
MQKRCEKLKIKWEHPPRGTIVDLENMNIKEKMSFLRANNTWKCKVKWEVLDEHETTWKTNGLVDLDYIILGNKTIPNSNCKATLLTVDVKLNQGHWADDKCHVDFAG